MRVRLQQPPRISRRLAVGQTIVLDLAQFLLLPPALLVGRFIGRRQHIRPNLAGKSWRVDEHVHVGVAGGHPQPVPARHGRERVLRAALGLGEEIGVMLVRVGERLAAAARPCSGGPYPPPNAPGCATSIDGALPSANTAMATQRRLRRCMTDSREGNETRGRHVKAETQPGVNRIAITAALLILEGRMRFIKLPSRRRWD